MLDMQLLGARGYQSYKLYYSIFFFAKLKNSKNSAKNCLFHLNK